MDCLNSNQKAVIEEVRARGLRSGGLSLPLGFGKTRTSISLGLSYDSGPILVIVSKTLLTSWMSEIPKAFGDSVKFEVLHQDYVKNLGVWKPSDDTRIVITTPDVLSKAYKEYRLDLLFCIHNVPEGFGPTILEYIPPKSNMLQTPHTGVGFVYSVMWGCLIVDEIQQCNNIMRDKCRAISCVAAQYRWGLSGTMFDEPKMERFLGYFTMLHIDGPRTLPDAREYFEEKFRGFKHYIVHRKDNPDFVDRPNYIEEIVTHELSDIEMCIFEASKNILNELNTRVKTMKISGDVTNARRFSAYMLAMITYVRQLLICPIIPITSIYCDIADFDERSELSEIIISKFEDIGIRAWLDDEASIMSTRFKEIMPKIDKHKKERVIIFSCFRTCITMLKHFVDITGRQTFTITSGMTVGIRSKTLEDFESSSDGVLLMTYNIGAEGLNLQCASVVMLVDLWWNDAKTQQAIGRVFRPGQKASDIFVYIFLSNTGMEQKMIEKNIVKKEILKELNDGASTIKMPKMTVADILLIINSESNKEYLERLRSM